MFLYFRNLNYFFNQFIKGAKIYWDDLMFDTILKFNPFTAYKQSKLANILFTRELAKRLKDTNVTVNTLHPGFVNTRIDRYLAESYGFGFRIIKAIFMPLIWLITKTPREGAQTTIHVAVSSKLNYVTGRYFSDCKEKELLPHALNDEDGERLWKVSEEYVKKYL